MMHLLSKSDLLFLKHLIKCVRKEEYEKEKALVIKDQTLGSLHCEYVEKVIDNYIYLLENKTK